MRIKARHHLREDAVRNILEYLKANFGESIEVEFAGKKLEIAESDEEQDFILVNDHDPKPLYYHFKAEYDRTFKWDYLDQGPDVWRVRISRTA